MVHAATERTVAPSWKFLLSILQCEMPRHALRAKGEESVIKKWVNCGTQMERSFLRIRCGDGLGGAGGMVLVTWRERQQSWSQRGWTTDVQVRESRRVRLLLRR